VSLHAFRGAHAQSSAVSQDGTLQLFRVCQVYSNKHFKVSVIFSRSDFVSIFAQLEVCNRPAARALLLVHRQAPPPLPPPPPPPPPALQWWNHILRA